LQHLRAIFGAANPSWTRDYLPIWKTDMKALKILGGFIAAIVVVAALLLVVGMPLGFLTSAIADRVERETGYRLTVAGSTRVGLWPSLNVTMSEVTLERPSDRDAGNRLTVGSIQANMTLSSLWSGQPVVTELAINRPVVSVPLRRERRPVARATSSPPIAPSDTVSGAPTIKRITVTDGTVTFFNSHDRIENHIESINAHAIVGADRQLSLNGNGRAGGHPLTFDVKASIPDSSLPRQTIPAEFSLEAPGLLQAPLSSKAEVRLNGTVVMINGISGSIGDGVFDGWASIDFATKPLVKLDLDFRRLDVAATPAPTSPQAAATAWSTDAIELNELNYVDAQVRLSAAELNIGSAHFAPVAIEASLASGILKGAISNLGAYGGAANGTVELDVSLDTPVYSVRSDLTGVRALPLLSSAAGFDKLDGNLNARIDVRSSGLSQQEIMSKLAGTVVANFRDGAIRDLNVAQMIRSLTSSTLSGWQENRQQTTDLTQLSASFRIEKGQATTTDLNLVGPLVKMTGAGTIDLGAQTLALRVEPKLVMTTEGQGRSSDPVGFGIPVVINGPWASPRIYPDVAGVLDNPDAAYAKLKEMGNGLFAPGGLGSGLGNGLGSGSGGNPAGGNGQSDTPGGNSLSDTLGNLIQQGLSAGRPRNGNSSPTPNSQPAPAPNDPAQPAQGGRSANDLLKQFFGR
jgi:AsmA protein